MCIAIIATKENVIIANNYCIGIYFTIVNGAQHHPTRVLYMKFCKTCLGFVGFYYLFMQYCSAICCNILHMRYY